MFLSKRSNGLYYLWFTDEYGNRRKISTNSRLKSEAIKFLSEFKSNEKLLKTRVVKKSLADFIFEYNAYSKTVHTQKTQRTVENALRQFLKIVGDVRLDKVGVREIEGFLATKKVEASEWTARSYYIHLASAFETAIRWNYISINPFRSVKRPRTKELQPVFVSRVEMEPFLKAIDDPQFRDLCFVALFTGLRLGELLNLQWADVDLIGKVIHVRNSQTFTTKSRKNRSIPIATQLYHNLILMKENASSELVFHLQGKSLSPFRISKLFKGYVVKAKMDGRLHFHSLRHTFASWLVQDGVSLYEVQKLLGHSSTSVTQIYSHLKPEQLHSTVNRISLNLN